MNKEMLPIIEVTDNQLSKLRAKWMEAKGEEKEKLYAEITALLDTRLGLMKQRDA